MHADSFHRLMKLLVDSGEAVTLEDAVNAFSSYGVRVVLDGSVAGSVNQQIIALTAINSAARSFQGNVYLAGAANLTLTVPGFEGLELQEFASWAGVNPACTPMPGWPEIRVGGPRASMGHGTLSPWASGWTFGLGDSGTRTPDTFAPACVAAGAIAVSEAFSLMRGDNPYAGRRALRFSLWSMTSDEEQPPPGTTVALECGAWLVGLGHLGQAYCWTLGMMEKSDSIPLVLQDMDIVTKSTLTTSMLSSPDDIGRKKTRVVAAWLERRGFDTSLVERRFDDSTRVAPGEPVTALFGVDNPSARRCCEGAGFSLVLDAGLGSGFRDFRALRVRAFPGKSSAQKLWAANVQPADVPLAAAYRALLATGKDPCGVTTLASRSVGAPFVGCYAAAVLISELMRRRATGSGNDVLDINLRAPEAVEVA